MFISSNFMQLLLSLWDKETVVLQHNSSKLYVDEYYKRHFHNQKIKDKTWNVLVPTKIVQRWTCFPCI